MTKNIQTLPKKLNMHMLCDEQTVNERVKNGKKCFLR